MVLRQDLVGLMPLGAEKSSLPERLLDDIQEPAWRDNGLMPKYKPYRIGEDRLAGQHLVMEGPVSSYETLNSEAFCEMLGVRIIHSPQSERVLYDLGVRWG